MNVALGDMQIGGNNRCYTIAEIGGNFESLGHAKKLIDLAAKAGCDAIKLQTFTADTITSKTALFDMENTGVASQWEHFRKYELSAELHRQVFEYAESRGLAWFSTPSHPSDVDLLEELGVIAHKIGSDDAVNIPLLKYVAGTGKPVLLSTGMCTISEVERALDAILEEGNDKVILFHCTTNYPTYPESVNLRAMVSMQDRLGVPVGYSDHTLGIDVCYAAAVLGAPILEFHFTDDRDNPGPDHVLSKLPEQVSELNRMLDRLPTILGDGVKRPAASEMGTRRNNRKSLIVSSPIRSGETISPDNIEIKRPGNGIPCDQYWNVIGKTVKRDLEADEVLSWEHLY